MTTDIEIVLEIANQVRTWEDEEVTSCEEIRARSRDWKLCSVCPLEWRLDCQSLGYARNHRISDYKSTLNHFATGGHLQTLLIHEVSKSDFAEAARVQGHYRFRKNSRIC